MKTLSQLLNEGENKTPAQMEMEHKDTAEWFAKEVKDTVRFHIGRDGVSEKDVDNDIKELLPEYFNKIVGDHEKEFKNYYTWLKWMEEKMKEYDTPTDYENKIKG
jgi:uncharacterized protein YacL (UPF0231 family)